MRKGFPFTAILHIGDYTQFAAVQHGIGRHGGRVPVGNLGSNGHTPPMAKISKTPGVAGLTPLPNMKNPVPGVVHSNKNFDNIPKLMHYLKEPLQ